MTLREIQEAEGSLTMANPADLDDMTVAAPDGCSHARIGYQPHRCLDCNERFPRLFDRAQQQRMDRDVDLGYSVGEDRPLSPEQAVETHWRKGLGH